MGASLSKRSRVLEKEGKSCCLYKTGENALEALKCVVQRWNLRAAGNPSFCMCGVVREQYFKVMSYMSHRSMPAPESLLCREDLRDASSETSHICCFQFEHGKSWEAAVVIS